MDSEESQPSHCVQDTVQGQAEGEEMVMMMEEMLTLTAMSRLPPVSQTGVRWMLVGRRRSQGSGEERWNYWDYSQILSTRYSQSHSY